MQQKSNSNKKSPEKSTKKNTSTLKEYLLVRDAFLEKYGMKGNSEKVKKTS